jgi:hypothetical protein
MRDARGRGFFSGSKSSADHVPVTFWNVLPSFGPKARSEVRTFGYKTNQLIVLFYSGQSNAFVSMTMPPRCLDRLAYLVATVTVDM